MSPDLPADRTDTTPARPVLLTREVRYEPAVGVTVDGDPTGAAVALHFQGVMLVDGEHVATDGFTAIIPGDAFGALLWQLDMFASTLGYRDDAEYVQCGSTLPAAGIDRGFGRVYQIIRCDGPANHPAPHYANNSPMVWTTATSASRWAKRADWYATRAHEMELP